MTVQQTFDNWVNSGLDWDKAPYEACSPNLLLLRTELGKRWPVGENLGCHADRDIRAGGTPSEHSWGAALDWRYPDGVADEVLSWVIGNSAELGICSIHDYLGCRIWRAGRTPSKNPNDWWRAQTPSTANGMGQSWANYFHFVTTIGKFGDTTPIADRLAPTQPVPVPPEDDMINPRFFCVGRLGTPDAPVPVWLSTDDFTAVQVPHYQGGRITNLEVITPAEAKRYAFVDSLSFVPEG